MICTKAYIKALPEEGSNIYKVEVPLMQDNTGTEAIFDALLCTTPGSYKGLNVGDCVFVDFEDDQYNTAIILGELFTDIPTKSTTYSIINDLKVTDAASLPPNTRFGDYTAQDIMNLYNRSGGSGSINPDDLKQYVQWIETETVDSEGNVGEPIYADKIRVMTGAQYDKLIEELGSEGIEEDINFINTLHFLLSLPGTSEGGGDEPEPGPTPPGPEPPGPEPEPGLSFKTLVNKLKSYLGKTDDYSDNNKVDLSLNIISRRINTILSQDKTGGSNYIYFPHFSWLESTKSGKWQTFYKYLPNPSLAAGRGAGNWLATDWESFDGDGTRSLEIGDIVTFFNSSGNGVYCAVYIGNDKYYGTTYIKDSSTAKLIEISKDEIIQYTSATEYKITRITQSLVDRHKGDPLN